MTGSDPHETPLVVTLVLDAGTTRRFDAERAEHFPAGRTAVGAHLTLFHAVPGRRADRVAADVQRATRREAFDVRVSAVRSLGRGAAYDVESRELLALHRELQDAWWEHLTAQDRQRLRPHVTVQNKVTPEVARATVERLRAGFAPFRARAEAVAVWRYVGGPWEPAGRFEIGP